MDEMRPVPGAHNTGVTPIKKFFFLTRYRYHCTACDYAGQRRTMAAAAAAAVQHTITKLEQMIDQDLLPPAARVLLSEVAGYGPANTTKQQKLAALSYALRELRAGKEISLQDPEED